MTSGDEISGIVVAIEPGADGATIAVRTNEGTVISPGIPQDAIEAIGIQVGEMVKIIKRQGAVIIGR